MTRRGRFVRIGWALTAVALLALCGVVHAQSNSAPPTPPPGRHGGHGPMSDDAMAFVGFEAGLAGKTVTGAPFSASFSTQTTQALADGNQIQHSATGTFARDSQGRTRRDITLPAIGPVEHVRAVRSTRGIHQRQCRQHAVHSGPGSKGCATDQEISRWQAWWRRIARRRIWAGERGRWNEQASQRDHHFARHADD